MFNLPGGLALCGKSAHLPYPTTKKPALADSVVLSGSVAVSMAGCWSFNEASGTSAANLAGGSPASLNGSAAFSSGTGTIVKTTGGTESVNFAVATAGSVRTGITASGAAWSMACWFKVAASPTVPLQSVMTMAGGGKFVLLDLAVVGFPTFNFTGAVYGSGGGPSAAAMGISGNCGTWYHLVLTRSGDSGTYTAYLDGTQVGTVSSGTLDPSGTQLWIGDRNGFSQPFEGDIDNAQFWNREISGSEVSAIYAAAFTFVAYA